MGTTSPAELVAAGLAQCHPTCLACHQRCSAVPLEPSRCHQPYLSSSAWWLSSPGAEPLCCHQLGFSSKHSWPRGCLEQPEHTDFFSSFLDETVHAAQGRAPSQCPSEVIAVPVSTSAMQAALSSHFVFQGRSLSEQALCHVVCVTEQCVLACIRKVVLCAAPGSWSRVILWSVDKFGAFGDSQRDSCFPIFLLPENFFRRKCI